MSATVERDERVVMVENASYRWAYLLLSFGLLVDVCYRSWVRHETSWDLFGLVILGGAVTTAYQRSNQVLGSRWAKSNLLVILAAAVIAVLIVLFKR
jgi:hypothetical protein